MCKYIDTTFIKSIKNQKKNTYLITYYPMEKHLDKKLFL